MVLLAKFVGGGYSKAAPKPLTTQKKFSLGFTLAIAALLFFLALALPARTAHATETFTIDGVTYQVNMTLQNSNYTDAEGNYLPYSEIVGISTSQSNKTIKVPASFSCEIFTGEVKEFPVFNVLTYMEAYQTPGATLDFTNCTELRAITTHGSYTKINVAGCTKLTSLSVTDGVNNIEQPISSLDLSGCISLKELSLDNAKISSVDVSSCKNLEEIDLSDLANLTSFDASGLSKLKSLNVGHCGKVGSVKLTGLSSLETLTLYDDRFSSLDLSQCPNLQVLGLSSGYLTSIDLSKNMQLKKLDSHCYGIKTLDLSNHAKLEELNCGGPFPDEGTDLRSVNLSGCSNLKDLDLHWNTTLSTLSLKGCSSLEAAIVYGCNLTTLDLSASKRLKEVDCHDNKLTSLNLSSNAQLKSISCGYNSLSTLNLTGCNALEGITCQYNNLTSLDVSHFPELQTIFANLISSDHLISARIRI